MSNIAIRVDNIGKRYFIGGQPQNYQTFRDFLVHTSKAPLRRVRDLFRGQAYGATGLKEEIWALKNVSFEVNHGEVVGIIGRNGAGKSTLLKILSRITEPTEGYADIYGRVGSLLEVGTGFHPELTGRENIYLNGAILGMSRRDIDRKFDGIVDFSGVERFIDTPVKHYSSGMGLRLGFAVAAHLEPDILVVDEVLAVGDAEFQKKCLGKMTDVASEGRTVIFVSHNMGAVASLCHSGILLKNGLVEMIGLSESVIEEYLTFSEESNKKIFLSDDSKPIQILEIALASERGGSAVFHAGETVHVQIKCIVREQLRNSGLSLVLSRNGVDILGTFDTDQLSQLLELRPIGVYTYDVPLPTHILKAGLYSMSISAGLISQKAFERYQDVLGFQLIEVDENTSHLGYAENRRGVLRMAVQWSIINMDSRGVYSSA